MNAPPPDGPDWMFDGDHLAGEAISAFVDGELDQDELDVTGAHVAGCDICAAMLDRFRSVAPTLAVTPRSPIDVRAAVASALAAQSESVGAAAVTAAAAAAPAPDAAGSADRPPEPVVGRVVTPLRGRSPGRRRVVRFVGAAAVVASVLGGSSAVIQAAFDGSSSDSSADLAEPVRPRAAAPASTLAEAFAADDGRAAPPVVGSIADATPAPLPAPLPAPAPDPAPLPPPGPPAAPEAAASGATAAEAEPEPTAAAAETAADGDAAATAAAAAPTTQRAAPRATTAPGGSQSAGDASGGVPAAPRSPARKTAAQAPTTLLSGAAPADAAAVAPPVAVIALGELPVPTTVDDALDAFIARWSSPAPATTSPATTSPGATPPGAATASTTASATAPVAASPVAAEPVFDGIACQAEAARLGTVVAHATASPADQPRLSIVLVTTADRRRVLAFRADTCSIVGDRTIP